MGSRVWSFHDLFSLKRNLGLISLCCTVQFCRYLMLLPCKIHVMHKTNCWFLSVWIWKFSSVESCGSSHTMTSQARQCPGLFCAPWRQRGLSLCGSYTAAGDICINKPDRRCRGFIPLQWQWTQLTGQTITLLHPHLNETIMLTVMNCTAPTQQSVSEERYICIIVTVKAAPDHLYRLQSC